MTLDTKTLDAIEAAIGNAAVDGLAVPEDELRGFLTRHFEGNFTVEQVVEAVKSKPEGVSLTEHLDDVFGARPDALLNCTAGMASAMTDAAECENDCGTSVIKQSTWRDLASGERDALVGHGFNVHGARGMCSPCYMRDYVRAYNPNDPLVLEAHVIVAEHGVFPPEAVEFTPTRQREAEEWTADASCNTTDPESFYPEHRADTSAVKRVCGPCPVRVDCLLSAVRHREEYGVWGGLTENELDRFYSELDAARPKTVEVQERAPRALVCGDAGYIEPELLSLVSEFDEQDRLADQTDLYFPGDDDA
jgi:hypothetical protein